MKQYVQVTIPVTQQDIQEMLVAQLSLIGYDAFEQDNILLKAFIGEEHFNEPALQELLEKYSLTYSHTVLPATNWNEEWEKNFLPVIIDDFCGIRASFHEPIENTAYEIIITPKMSFGTGHHATTHMMVQLMCTVDFPDKYVFDFGTGTGVLAILADKLGASEVIAIDNDDWSMLNAAENLSANKCEHVALLKAGNIPASKSFDIILANINKQVIAGTLQQMRAQLSTNGSILLSGLLQDDFDDVHKLAHQNGLQLQQQLSRAGWIALKYTHR
jgi:ribosomal protein L11 methyltransferase